MAGEYNLRRAWDPSVTL